MYISKVYIRFYRSFNYDYLRAADGRVDRFPWDYKDDLFYPFVKITLEKGITAVVGANESGKSQLLGAIKHSLTGQGLKRVDFCRYSHFFAVDRSMSYPEFGIELKELTEELREFLVVHVGINADQLDSSIHVFRLTDRVTRIFLRQGDEWLDWVVENVAALDLLLPRWFEINAEVALPDSVPLAFLASDSHGDVVFERSQRLAAINKLAEAARKDDDDLAIKDALSSMRSALDQDDKARDAMQLADHLLIRIARIDRSAFQELLELATDGDDGFANGVVDRINAGLTKGLNFPKWWSQDHRFELKVTLKDFDLVFTIRDRTGTEYAFGERSGGLRFFLSYFVQYLAHDHSTRTGGEILLMDEPDAYLSSQGQQDLLKIFNEFAYPLDDRPPCQVVYVTHSPFLIDKNHGERVRVLEKGEADEGTRIVKDASKNHYEPLRSSFGSFVGETTFISNCNLFVEGMADQVLIAGMASRFTRKAVPKKERIDLNTITMVPAGSAQHIPYLVQLARGRDATRPAVIVLLDGDGEGERAYRGLFPASKEGKRYIRTEWALRLSDLKGSPQTANPKGVVDIEDLLPLSIAWRATAAYADEMIGAEQARKLLGHPIEGFEYGDTDSTHDVLEKSGRKLLGEKFHIDKVGLAKHAVELINQEAEDLIDEIGVADRNFRLLFAKLFKMQELAVFDQQKQRNGTKIRRIVKKFDQDFPGRATIEDAARVLSDIERELDPGPNSDAIVSQIREIRGDYRLDRDLSSVVSDLGALKSKFESLISAELRASQEELTYSVDEM